MPGSLKQIEGQAKMLAPEDRAKLAEFMLESLRPSLDEIEQAWEQDIKQRVAAFDRGEISAYSAESVFAELRRFTR